MTISIFIAIISIIVIIYGTILFDTNNVMKEVRDTLLFKTDYAETANKQIDKYNISSGYVGGKPHVLLVRLSTRHNFKDGYIWAWYWFRVYNTEGKLTSYWWTPTKWKIHKENGKWEIVEIYEAP